MTTDAVVLLDYPPAVLNVLPARVFGIVEKRGWHVCAFRANASQQESSQRSAALGLQIRTRHAQAILLIFLFAAIVNRGLGDLVFEETLVVVPGLLLVRRGLGRARGCFMQLERIVSLFRLLGQQGKVEPLDWRRAFDGQLF